MASLSPSPHHGASLTEILGYARRGSHNAHIQPDQLVESGQLNELRSAINYGKVDAKSWKEPGTGRNLLHLAAASNQVEILAYLTNDAGMDYNVQDSDGNTSLHLAVLCGKAEATNAILSSHKADAAICNSSPDPPLHLAIKQVDGSSEVLAAFIKHLNVDLFVHGYSDRTTLHILAGTNSIKALKLFHAEVVARMKDQDDTASNLYRWDRNGHTAFHLAARVGSCEFLEYMLCRSTDYGLSSKDLLDRISTTGCSCKSPLHFAIEHGHVDCVRILLSHGGYPMTTRDGHPPPLHLACSLGKLDIVKIIVSTCRCALESRDLEGGTALHSSTSSIRCKELISYLVEIGVKVDAVDANGFSALSNAIYLGNINAVEELLKQGADTLVTDKLGRTSLHQAVISKRQEAFRKIMESDQASVMAATVDNHGNLPVHHALKFGLSEMAIALLAMNPGLFKDRNGNNFMHIAATDEKCLVHLLSMPSAQEMINEANNLGFTPLHYAAMGPSIATVKLLLNHGAVTHRNNDGHTPFMCACSKGNLEAVRLLYSNNKFQRDWVDHSGSTALHLAVDSRNPDLITFCLDTGMAVTLNNERLSFFDRILCLGRRKMAGAALRHRRWEECMDVSSPEKPHPILRILDRIPEVYGVILDQCYTTCSLDSMHPDYWEDFNYKCLDLRKEEPDTDQEERQRREQEERQQKSEKTEAEMIMTDMGWFSQLHTENDVVVKPVTSSSGREATSGISRRRIPLLRWRRKESEGSLAVVRKLILKHQESYLLHPVVVSFIRQKWEGFGMQFQIVIMFIHFLLALFLSIFVVSLPLPPQQSVPVPENESENCTGMESDYVSVGVGSEVLLYITLLLSLLNLAVFFLQVYIHAFNLILDFASQFQIWANLVASSCALIFVISILAGGLGRASWGAAALAEFFVWISVGFTLQLVNILNMGIYVTMLLSTTRLIFKVLSILLVFLLAFAFPLHILVGSEPRLQYKSIGLSLFSVLHSLIAVTDYLGFANLEQSGVLRFSHLVFLFLVILIVMLPIVIVNLLIGLAVGDIARIRKEAIISHQSVEVRALASLDKKLLPHNWRRKKATKKKHRHHPNKISWGYRMTRLFHRTFDSSDEVEAAEGGGGDLRDMVQRELLEERKCREKHMEQLHQRIEELAADRLVQLDGIKRLENMLARVLQEKLQEKGSDV